MTSKQTLARRAVATQTEPLDSVCVFRSLVNASSEIASFHELSNASRMYEKRTCEICGWSDVSNHSAENRESWNRSEKSARRSCFTKTVMGAPSQVDVSTHPDERLGASSP